jgi:antirestriction protein ArdC
MSNKVYEIITERIIEKLEQGTIPWRKPWAEIGYPKNLISGKEYKSINVLLLVCQGYTSPYWLSMNQCLKLGGSKKAGEKPTIITFRKQITFSNNEGDEVTEKTIPFLRYYRMFNTEQCTGLKIPVIETNTDFKPIEQCELIIDNMPNKPDITHTENYAYYNPTLDYINIPKQEMFTHSEEYYSTLFHELGHSTMQHSRCNRTIAIKDKDQYGKEELTAEITATFLCNRAGIEQKTLDNSASYIQGWLAKLKHDPKLVILAAAQAQKATDFILNKIKGDYYVKN